MVLINDFSKVDHTDTVRRIQENPEATLASQIYL